MLSVKNYSQGLPPDLVKIIEPYHVSRSPRTEPDFYGASTYIAKKLDLIKIPRSFSSWSHGCHTASMRYKEQIIWNDVWCLNRLVRNQEVADFLINKNVKNVIPVGLPIVYIDSLGIQRREKSVLFMPAHSLDYIEVEDYKTDQMITQALTLKAKGYYVCFCIHGDCVKKKKIFPSLDSNKIDWFSGSSVEDLNSLQRMRNIFEYFEFVTSNTIGSHFYYSQLFDAKFFFTTPYFEYEFLANMNSPSWKNREHILKFDLKELSESSIRKKYENYFTNVEGSFCDKHFAQTECGLTHKVALQNLAGLLGWNKTHQIACQLPYYASKILNKITRAYF